MPDRINACLIQKGGSPIPTTAENGPRFANLIFHSLAARYEEVLTQIRSVTGKDLKSVHIVGGGSKNQFLNGLIREKTKLQVHRGPVESSTIGNLAIQFAVLDGDSTAAAGVNAEAARNWAAKLSSLLPN
jgi:rhamnulokinase